MSAFELNLIYCRSDVSQFYNSNTILISFSVSYLIKGKEEVEHERNSNIFH